MGFPTPVQSKLTLLSYPNTLSIPFSKNSLVKAQSPILTSNRSSPLRKPSNTNSTSSLSTRPIFPPGFESSIPNKTNQAHAKKRPKKFQKTKNTKIAILFQPHLSLHPPQLRILEPLMSLVFQVLSDSILMGALPNCKRSLQEY